MNLLEPGGPVYHGRSVRGRGQDLDLRLGPRAKSANFAHSRSSAQAVTIVVEDDDDEVQVSSPRSFSQARLSAIPRSNRTVHVPILDDEDLELRLGLAGTGPPTLRVRNPGSSGELNPQGACLGLSLNATIDLTSTSDDSEMLQRTTGKRKYAQSALEPSREIRLTCAICMDTMKEETSTVCGHLFCNACILGAIQAQKKCPNCRKKLTSNSIHRIYLSGSTS